MILKMLILIMALGIGFFIGKSQIPNQQLPTQHSQTKIQDTRVEIPKDYKQVNSFQQAEAIILKAKNENKEYKPERMKRITKEKITKRFERLKKMGALQKEPSAPDL